MAMKKLFGLSCCALLLVAGCGKPTMSGSCARADHSQCTDYSERSADLTAAQYACTTDGNTWSSAGCTTTGYVGGCRVIEGIVTQTDWFFGTARTTEEIRNACPASGGTFIAP
jgi:hypothetical protein